MPRTIAPTLILLLVAVACGGPESVPPQPEASPTSTTGPPTTVLTGTTEPGEDDPAPPVGRRAADLPGPRTEVTGTTWEGRIVAVGGLDEGGWAMADAWIYAPARDAWDPLPDLPVPLHHTAVAVLDGRLFVVGGYGMELGDWASLAEVWSLGPGEDAWREEPSLRMARGALAVASTGERLVAMGGVDPRGRVLTSSEVLMAGGEAWEPGPDLTSPREHLAATAVGSDVYAIAGRAGGLDTNLASVEMLVGDAWQEAPPLSFSRGGIGAATVNGLPCVAGGEEPGGEEPGGTIGPVECLIGEDWTVVAELEIPRHGLAVAALDGRLHVVGGGPEPGLTVSGVHEVIPVPAR